MTAFDDDSLSSRRRPTRRNANWIPLRSSAFFLVTTLQRPAFFPSHDMKLFRLEHEVGAGSGYGEGLRLRSWSCGFWVICASVYFGRFRQFFDVFIVFVSLPRFWGHGSRFETRFWFGVRKNHLCSIVSLVEWNRTKQWWSCFFFFVLDTP